MYFNLSNAISLIQPIESLRVGPLTSNMESHRPPLWNKAMIAGKPESARTAVTTELPPPKTEEERRARQRMHVKRSYYRKLVRRSRLRRPPDLTNGSCCRTGSMSSESRSGSCRSGTMPHLIDSTVDRPSWLNTSRARPTSCTSRPRLWPSDCVERTRRYVSSRPNSSSSRPSCQA